MIEYLLFIPGMWFKHIRVSKLCPGGQRVKQ
jgi:hypothetical protein